MDSLVRQPVAAGRFYPGNSRALTAELAKLVPPFQPRDDVISAFVPHAGYVFSGRVAGEVFSRIKLAETVVLLGPNHTGRGKDLAVWESGAWRTPLGDAGVDEALSSALLAAKAGFVADREAHLADHALEVVLPFIQYLAPSTRIVPICVSGRDLASLECSGRALAAVLGKRAGVSILVSTDMSHYVPNDVAHHNDHLALDAMQALDGAALARCVNANRISMCGVAPAILALAACREMGACSAEAIAYATSGETGKAFGADMDKVVGYAGVLIR